MSNTVDLGIRVTSDIAGGVSGLRTTEGALGKVKGVALGVAAAVGAVTVAAGTFAVSAIGEAGNLEQSIGAIDTVFKTSSGQMHTWAQSAAQEVGLTRNEFNELGTLIGTQLKNGGTAMEDLGPKTKDLIGLGADLSSMFGGTSKEAVEALSSALKGERDPIEKYGVSLKQATIDAKAAEMGFTKVGGSLSDEANQAATLALIMEQTADAHGNFAKESNTLQGQQQRFNAQMANTKAIIGTALLPVATALFSFFNETAGPAVADLADKFSAFVSGLDVAGWWANLTSSVSGASGVLAGIQPVVEGIAGWFTGSLMPAIEGLVGSFQERFAVIQEIVGEFAAGLWTHIEPLMPQFEAVFTTVGEIVTTAVDLVTEVWDQGTAFLLAAWEIVGGPITDTVGGIMSAVMGIIGPAMDTIKSIIKTVLAIIQGDWRGAWDGVKGILDGAWRLIKSIVTGAIDVVKSVISGALGIIRNLWSSAWDGIKSTLDGAWTNIKSAVSRGIDDVVNWFTGLPGRITGAISGLGNKLYNVGKDILQGLINGVKAMAGRVVDSVKGVIDGAIGGAKRLLGIASPSKVFKQFGLDTGAGFVAGLTGQASAVSRAGRQLVGAAVPTNLPTIDITARRGALDPDSPPGIQITVNGALDPDAVARQIVEVLDRYVRRTGTRPLNGSYAT